MNRDVGEGFFERAMEQRDLVEDAGMALLCRIQGHRKGRTLWWLCVRGDEEESGFYVDDRVSEKHLRSKIENAIEIVEMTEE